MDSESMRQTGSVPALARGADIHGVLLWLVGFALVAYLGLEGGGYDPLVHDEVGIAVWWALLGFALVGALPRTMPGPLALAALALLTGLVAWTALSLTWTESGERTWADLARLAAYLGVFVLALGAQGRGRGRWLLGGVACGVVLVAGIALLSRLHPDWFPEAGQTAAFLNPGRERLSYPIQYWNGLAALIAIGFPLVLHFAAAARSSLLRGLAAAALPLLVLTIFFTLSRSGIAASAVALAIYLLLAADRLPKLLSLVLAGGGAVVLALAADRRESLQDGLLDATARSQGDEMLVMTVAVCAVVGLLQAALAMGLGGERRPYWSFVPHRPASIATGLAVAIAVVALLAAGAPGRAADAWANSRSQAGRGRGPGGSAARPVRAATSSGAQRPGRMPAPR
ncbi:MAG TPA: hypothetical protein VHF50_05830 [Solirubrobacterales bacterium]|nr:hypothetical protein [Solirubrobacterales bacterium]